MSKYNDPKYIGLKSGKLEVIDFGYDDNNNFMWLCKCSCNTTSPKLYSPSKVFNGRVQSCGCNKINNRSVKYRSKEYINQIYAGLKVIGISSPCGKYDGTMWECMCTCCGAIRNFPAKHVVSGRYTSCGSVECRRLLKLNKSKYDNEKFIGRTFGNLKVERISYRQESNTTSVYWECECTVCGNKCIFPAHSVARGNNSSCGCTKSIGEKYIKEVLDKYNIVYNQEVKFKGLVGINGGNLRFDFAVIDRKGNKKLIEYDGAQHDEASLYQNTCWDIERVLLHDKLKSEFCEKNKIELVRISKRFKSVDDAEKYLLNNNII